MTAGHKHRVVTLKEQGILLHLLRTPLVRTCDPARAERSKWVWGQTYERVAGDGPIRDVAVFVLTPLGILHRFTGLTVDAR